MARVLVLDADSTIPNLALMRLAAWHRAQRDDVSLTMTAPTHRYVSTVFSWSRPKVRQWLDAWPEAVVGGAGWDLSALSPEVEAMRPDFRLYWDRFPTWRGVGLGFLQRGCPRSCAFCIVPAKEGKPKAVATLDDLINPDWQATGWRRPFLVLLDNNFLALGRWTLDTLAEMAERRVDVCFSQGLDIRLVTPEIATALARVAFWNLGHSRRQMTFAFDSVTIEPGFRRGVRYLFEAGIKAWQLQSFVLVGFDSTFDEDRHRIEVIRSYGIDPFVMVYRDLATGKAPADPRLRHFARWINRRLYKVCRWEEYAGWRRAERKPRLVMEARHA